MKTILIFIFGFISMSLSAQTYYYSETKTFNEDQYTYQCDISTSMFVTLYNKENQFTHVKRIFKDDPNRSIGIDVSPFEEDTWTRQKCFSIVNKSFSVEERNRVSGYDLNITLHISSETGKIIDVEFNFLSVQPYSTIPLSVYRNIELELKKNIWFTPTADGKRMNYIFLSWGQEITRELNPDAKVIVEPVPIGQ